MKILILQLARLGDIYQTWPMIQGLKEKYPDSQMDILVRPRFVQATKGLRHINQVYELPMTELFEPLVQIEPDINQSLATLSQILRTLKSNEYDWVINTSFSPASSYITHFLENLNTRISGYTRHSDGYLALPDDASAYFYAQVGLSRWNRIHLSDIFCLLADLDYKKKYWELDIQSFPKRALPFNKYIVIHIGASQSFKSYPAFKWRATLSHFIKSQGISVVLIGSAEDQKNADQIAFGYDENIVMNLVGKTELIELFWILKEAALFVGCDSAPLHMASLTDTPTLNIPFETVNFWETGPKVDHCRVLFGSDDSDIPSEVVAKNITEMIQNSPPSTEVIRGVSDIPSYQKPLDSPEREFPWQLIRALYVDAHIPEIPTETLRSAFHQIDETNQIMLHQLEQMEKTRDILRFKEIYDRADEIIATIGQLIPQTQPLVSWYQTEKIRIGPASAQSIFQKTKQVHITLNQFLNSLLTTEGLYESLNTSAE